MLSKKSKIEWLRKSRKGQVLVVSVAVSLCRARTEVCDRFSVVRCGPSRCPAWDAPVGLKNFVRQPEKTFSTASVKPGSRRSFDNHENLDSTKAKCRDCLFEPKARVFRSAFVVSIVCFVVLVHRERDQSLSRRRSWFGRRWISMNCSPARWRDPRRVIVPQNGA
jgi:hypothetical protein